MKKFPYGKLCVRGPCSLTRLYYLEPLRNLMMQEGDDNLKPCTWLANYEARDIIRAARINEFNPVKLAKLLQRKITDFLMKRIPYMEIDYTQIEQAFPKRQTKLDDIKA